MKTGYIQKFLSLLCICLIIGGCSLFRKNKVQREQEADLYNPASSPLQPQLSVFHTSDWESQMYVAINTSDLVINEANEQAKPIAEVLLKYELYDCTDDPNNRAIADSAAYANSIEINKHQKMLVFPIAFKADAGRQYLLRLLVYDYNRRMGTKLFLNVDKLSNKSAQNFKVSMLNGSPNLNHIVTENDLVRITYLRTNIDSLYVRYQQTKEPSSFSALPMGGAPPMQFRTDSIWKVPYNPQLNLRFPLQGSYLIQTDTTAQEGLLLCNYGSLFPREDRVRELLGPVRYLSSSNEYKKLLEEPSPKQALDNFWLSVAGSTEKARTILRVYYTRMTYANRYFTDCKEGWKTDRGMIYMVYGLPNNIIKGSQMEIWEYKRKNNANPLSFTFRRKQSPYTENYYVLERGDGTPTYWNQAIQVWKSGQIFTVKDLD